jgi:pyruvate dehydrogenase E2 component (dihydrolipoamide acetyltransferase)
MPSLGADMDRATLTEWTVKPGDSVRRGDVVATVETTKGIIDIEIFGDGVIETLLVEPGAEVEVGAVLAIYRGAGESASAAASAQTPPVSPTEPLPKPPPDTLPQPLPPSEPPVSARVPSTPATALPPSGSPAGGRLPVSPAARRRAAELGIDIASVASRHPGAAVTLEDVERTARETPPSAPSAMRTLIAQSMSRSKREIPHYYLGTTIGMTRALDFVAAWNAAHPVTERLMAAALLLKAVALALVKVPELNGFWRDGRFVPGAAINVGTATRLRRGGLVAPALEAADRQPLPELMRRFQDVVQRARAGRLRQAELSTATITVSSLGEGTVETLYPIIHPPQVAIVGFGAVVVRPWCVADQVVPAPVVHATLSADHRASDGHRGSVFLAEVDRLLQHPEEL